MKKKHRNALLLSLGLAAVGGVVLFAVLQPKGGQSTLGVIGRAFHNIFPVPEGYIRPSIPTAYVGIEPNNPILAYSQTNKYFGVPHSFNVGILMTPRENYFH